MESTSLYNVSVVYCQQQQLTVPDSGLGQRVSYTDQISFILTITSLPSLLVGLSFISIFIASLS